MFVGAEAIRTDAFIDGMVSNSYKLHRIYSMTPLIVISRIFWLYASQNVLCSVSAFLVAYLLVCCYPDGYASNLIHL